MLLLVTDLAPGDRLRVAPGEIVPTDGILADGISTFDESLLTGEPLSLPYLRSAELARWTQTILERERPERIVIFSGPMAQYVTGRVPQGATTLFERVDAAGAAPDAPIAFQDIYHQLEFGDAAEREEVLTWGEIRERAVGAAVAVGLSMAVT